jgi:hypothetical protein
VKLLWLLAVLLTDLGRPHSAAASPVLVVTAGGATQQFTSDELLARQDCATLKVPHDPSYGRPMSYRAVPLRTLLSALPPDSADRPRRVDCQGAAARRMRLDAARITPTLQAVSAARRALAR